MTITTALPRWDMTTIFPGVDSPEYAASVDRLQASIVTLNTLLNEAETIDGVSGPEVTAHFEKLVEALNAAIEIYVLNDSFLYGFVSVDSRDEAAQARTSELEYIGADFSKARTVFTAWLGKLEVESLLASSALAREHEYMVRKASIQAEHLMGRDLEALASDLTLSGGSAWDKLHSDISSQIMVQFEGKDGIVRDLPMTEIRNLANDADPAIRRRAFEAELAAWKQWETPLAAALNGIKGEHATITERRGWESILDEAVFQNGIDRDILEAMMSAARDAFPDFRRYFRAKAKALGLESLAFADLFAPFEVEGRDWTWEEGFAFVHEQFSAYSPKMGGLAERALNERWIDVEPRPGKSGGAFCMGIRKDESRVLLNFTDSFGEVRTLAHELGHAYHNLCQVDVSPLRRMATPMTLAETASTFCETILTKAAIAAGTPDEKLSYLENSLQDAAQIVVDISSRFLFEQAVCEKRRERALSASEFCDLMLDAQRQTYGDGLDEASLHPYMWAVKSHYYSSSYAFYNYPYMFGLLFAYGLYARFESDPEDFRQNYDALLASTGDSDAATLAQQFGVDVRSREFWDQSLAVIRQDIDVFEALVNARLAKGM